MIDATVYGGVELSVMPRVRSTVSTSGGLTCNNKSRRVVLDRKLNAHLYINQMLADVVVSLHAKKTLHRMTEFCSKMALDHTR